MSFDAEESPQPSEGVSSALSFKVSLLISSVSLGKTHGLMNQSHSVFPELEMTNVKFLSLNLNHVNLEQLYSTEQRMHTGRRVEIKVGRRKRQRAKEKEKSQSR